MSSSSEDVVGRSLVTECPLSEFWLPNDGARELGVMVVAAVAIEVTVGWRLKLNRPVIKGLAGFQEGLGEVKGGAYLSKWYDLCSRCSPC